MKMTYRKLKEALAGFTEEQLDCDVSIMLHDHEFYELDGNINFSGKDFADDEDDPSIGILDEGHPWLSIFTDLG